MVCKICGGQGEIIVGVEHHVCWACGPKSANPAQKDGVNSPHAYLRESEALRKLTDSVENAPRVKAESMANLLEELNALTGLRTVKTEVLDLINLARVRQLRIIEGLPINSMSLHLIFAGNPGTGKTTVARIIGRIYRCLNLVTRGQVVEVDRSGLVSGYVGQTALKVQEVLDQAEGGVLFIDEAYGLADDGNGGFGKEAIEALLKGMEDRRSNLVVIVAGYTDLMTRFLSSNPGLQSRFGRRIEFPDYTPEDLLAIFENLCMAEAYELNAEARIRVRATIGHIYHRRSKHFGNGREMRKLFERCVTRHAGRISRMDDPTRIQLVQLTSQDVSED